MAEFISIISLFVLLGFLYFVLYIYISRKQEREILQKVEATCAEKENNIVELSEIIEIQKNVILGQKAEINSQNIGINKLKERNDTITSQKKSSEVRLGQISEQLIPFTNGYLYNHKAFHFLGWPCDGLQVEEDAIIFIEFKSGKAKLSESQKKVRDLVAAGKVRFETFRIDETGIHLKLESDMGKIVQNDTNK